MSSDPVWYYCDLHGHQHGPITAKILVDEHGAGHVSDESLIWSESLTDWMPFSEVPEVYSQVVPVTVSPSKGLVSDTSDRKPISSAAPKFHKYASSGAAKPNLVEAMAKKQMATLARSTSSKTAPTTTTTWTKVTGDDGYPYYTNVDTNETSWDRPEEYHSDDDLKSQQPPADTKPIMSRAGFRSMQPASHEPPKMMQPAPAGSDRDQAAIRHLEAALASLKSEFDEVTTELRAALKSASGSNQEVVRLKTELSSCKNEVKGARSDISDCQKSLADIQASLKLTSQTVTSLQTSLQQNFKLVRSVAKSLTDGIKE